MNPRVTAVLAVLVAALAAFLWFYEIRGAEERADAEAAERNVFQGVTPEAISELRVRVGDAQLARLERVEGAWRLTEPLSFPADTVAVDGLVQSLVGLPAEERYESPGPPAEYGLDVPPRITASAGGRELVLRIGDESPLAGNSYVAGAADAPVYVVQTYRVRAFEKSLDDLREKRVLDFPRDEVEVVRLSWPEGGVGLARRDGDWRIVEPLAADADDRAVDQLLSDLGFLRATGFVDEPDDDALGALGSPALEVALLGAPGADGPGDPLAALAIGGTLADGQRIASSGGTRYVIAAERLEDFPRSVDAYRFKELARFVASDARRFELAFQEGGQSTLFEGRRTEAGWETGPEALDAAAVSRLLAELSHLEADSVAAESLGESEREALGLAPARATFRVFGDEEAVLAEVELGALDPERGIPAARPGGAAVYWLGADLAGALPVDLAALRAGFLARAEVPGDPNAVVE